MAQFQSDQSKDQCPPPQSALGLSVIMALCTLLLLGVMAFLGGRWDFEVRTTTAMIQARAFADAAGRIDSAAEPGAQLLREAIVGLEQNYPNLKEALLLEGAELIAHTDPELVDTRLNRKNLEHKPLYDDTRTLEDNLGRNIEERKRYPDLTRNPYETVSLRFDHGLIYVAAPVLDRGEDFRGIVALKLEPTPPQAGGFGYQLALIGGGLIILAWLLARFAPQLPQGAVGLLFLGAMVWTIWFQVDAANQSFQRQAAETAAHGFTAWETLNEAAESLPGTTMASSSAEFTAAVNLDRNGNPQTWFVEASDNALSGDRVIQGGSSWIRFDNSLGIEKAGAWWGFAAVMALMVLYMLLLVTGRTRKIADVFSKQWYAYAYVSPAVIGSLLLVFGPFLFAIALGFFSRVYNTYEYVGIKNYFEILSNFNITESKNFYRTLGVTVMWTGINVSLHVSIGLGLAMILKDKSLKFTPVYRTLLIIPWALPNYITALIWKGMFNKEYGVVNEVLVLFGLEPVSWFTTFWGAFTANLATNVWLGFPFMMVISLGALQSIPPDLYEAADVDGAGRWVKFRRITLPLLKPALFPAVILGIIWTFNNFNVVYLVSGGAPDNKTDILITEAYRWAFERDQYGYASAYSMIIFVVLFSYTVITNRITKSTEGAFD